MRIQLAVGGQHGDARGRGRQPGRRRPALGLPWRRHAPAPRHGQRVEGSLGGRQALLTALAAAAVLRAARAARRTVARVARLEGWGVAASGFGEVGGGLRSMDAAEGAEAQ